MISTKPALSKVFLNVFFSGRLGRCAESSGELPTIQFAYRKSLLTVIHFFVSHAQQSTLESGQGAFIELIDLSADFYRVNHQGILYKLCSVGVEGSVLPILT